MLQPQVSGGEVFHSTSEDFRYVLYTRKAQIPPTHKRIFHESRAYLIPYASHKHVATTGITSRFEPFQVYIYIFFYSIHQD